MTMCIVYFKNTKDEQYPGTGVVFFTDISFLFPVMLVYSESVYFDKSTKYIFPLSYEF